MFVCVSGKQQSGDKLSILSFLLFYMHFDVLVVFSLSLTFSIKSLFPTLLHHPAEHWICVHHGRHGRMLDRLELGRLGDQVVSGANGKPGAVVAALIAIVWRRENGITATVVLLLPSSLFHLVRSDYIIEPILLAKTLSHIGSKLHRRATFTHPTALLLLRIGPQ